MGALLLSTLLLSVLLLSVLLIAGFFASDFSADISADLFSIGLVAVSYTHLSSTIFPLAKSAFAIISQANAIPVPIN